MLTICHLNAENLFISLDHHNGESFDNMGEGAWRRLALPQLRRKQKPLRKLWRLGASLLDINADILMLVEVGGLESLNLFNTHFLNNLYTPLMLDSNSSRGIDLAFLVKKDLTLSPTIYSNREAPVEIEAYHGTHTARFSRDVAELHLKENGELKLILLLTHLKSKISTDRDPQGTDTRRAEAQALSHLYEKVKSTHPRTPIVVGGDFNSELTSPELESLTKTDLIDFHTVLDSKKDDQISFIHFDYKGKPHPQTLDYLLLSPHLREKVIKSKSHTFRYKSFYDIPHPLPNTVSERYQMPSDHFPLVLVLDI